MQGVENCGMPGEKVYEKNERNPGKCRIFYPANRQKIIHKTIVDTDYGVRYYCVTNESNQLREGVAGASVQQVVTSAFQRKDPACFKLQDSWRQLRCRYGSFLIIQGDSLEAFLMLI